MLSCVHFLYVHRYSKNDSVQGTETVIWQAKRLSEALTSICESVWPSSSSVLSAMLPSNSSIWQVPNQVRLLKSPHSSRCLLTSSSISLWYSLTLKSAWYFFPFSTNTVHIKLAMITVQLNATLKINRLKVIFVFNWARTAPLKAIQNMAAKKSKTRLVTWSIPFINSIIAATDPIQLWPIIAIAA